MLQLLCAAMTPSDRQPARASRKQRSEARRSVESILDAARAVLADDPNASLTEIAERAGLHRVTLYRHFPTREALVQALTEASLGSFQALVAEAEASSRTARDVVRGATVRWFRASRDCRIGRYVPLGGLPRGEGGRRFRERMMALFGRGQHV